MARRSTIRDVEHLIRLGHRRVATITGRLSLSAGQDRLEGYRQALQAHGFALDDDLIVEGDFGEVDEGEGPGDSADEERLAQVLREHEETDDGARGVGERRYEPGAEPGGNGGLAPRAMALDPSHRRFLGHDV